MPGPIFKFKRTEILQRFLARPRLYGTDFFAARYEAPARRNLEESIRKLKRRWG